jgi:hypothetical protein
VRYDEGVCLVAQEGKEMKAITLADAKTGEQLNIQFNLEEARMEINGNPVVRKWALEYDENLFIYGSPWETTLYHLNRDQIEQTKTP